MRDVPKFIKEPDPTCYLGEDYIVFDFETTNLDKGDARNPLNRPICVGWKRGGESDVTIEWGDEYHLARFVRSIADVQFLVAHNAKFDLHWLARCGVSLYEVLVYCTQIGEYVRLGNRRQGLSLNACASRYGLGEKSSIVDTLIKGGVCPSEIPEQWLEKYLIQDVVLTEQLFLKQREILAERGLLPVQYTRCIATPMLADIENNGVQLDCDKVLGEYNDYEKRWAAASAELASFTDGINPASPRQVATYLYETLGFDEIQDYSGKVIRTPAGHRATGKETLLNLKARTKEQRQFLKLQKKYQPLNTALKTLTKMKACCEEAGGLLYANFNQTVTQTHRLSSTGAHYKLQFHNFAREFKHLFRSRRKAWVVGEGDGRQLEFRVAAHLGRDRQASTDILNGDDIHAFAAGVLGVERTPAKKDTFKPLYGGSSGTARQRKYYTEFRNRYKGIYSTQKGWTAEVLVNKQLVTESGLIFYWPQTKLERSGYITNTSSIFNYPVQMFATADIIPIAATCMWHRARGAEMFMVNTVHDSAIWELPEKEIELFHLLVVQGFTRDVYKYLKDVYKVDFSVCLGAGIKTDTHWSLGEETKIDVTPEGEEILRNE